MHGRGHNSWPGRSQALLTSVATALALIALIRPTTAQIQQRTTPDRDFLSYGSQVTYLNHAASPFRPFPVFGWEVPRYDRLGRYLMEGRVMISADEQRPGISKIDGLRFETGNVFQVGADFNYQVLQDSYQGRSYALMVLLASTSVETAPVKSQFSPLTLNMARYNGVRFDVSGAKNKATLLYTKGAGDRNRFSMFEVGRDDQAPVILWGGHWESQVGSALRLGTTFVNQHILDADSRRGGIVKGDLSNDLAPPELIAVRIVDDSPAVAATPGAAYGVAIIVKGTDAEGVERTLTSDAALAGADIEFDASLAPGPPDLTGARRVGDHWEAEGEEAKIEFVFEFPDGEEFRPTEVRFVATVGGDYRIQVRQEYIHTFTRILGGRRIPGRLKHQWPAKPRPSAFERAGYEFDSGDLRYPTDFKFPEKTPAYTVVRAQDTPRDVAPKTVRFDYGFPTAQSLASVEAHVDYAGFKVDGEIALNAQYFKFPVKEGRRSDKDALAYYLTGLRQLPGALAPELGVEVFRIDGDYSGNYDSRRGGAIFHTSVPVSPPNTAITQEFNLFDDNDDGDQWPDEMPNDTALSGANDAGVYPGLDANGDNVPDTDQNANGIPDWEEPFLFFWADPPEFIYDIDFNNNTLPDLTENDDRPDYPYDRDRRGHHLFVRWQDLAPHLEMLTLGLYRSQGLSSGGDSDARYLRYRVGWRGDGDDRVILRGDVKQVEDSLPDPVFIWRTTANPRDNSNVIQDPVSFSLIDVKDPDPDPMMMRHSMVSTMNIDTEIGPLPGLTVHTNYKWLLNRQQEDRFDDGTAQRDKTLSRLTLSSRLEYLRRLGADVNLYFRLRHLFWHDAGYPASARQHWMTWGPMFEQTWQLTQRSSLVAGEEGIPGLLPVSHTDYDREDRDFDRWTNVFMLRVQGNYIGWKTVTELGVEFERLEARHAEASNRTFFLEMSFGF